MKLIQPKAEILDTNGYGIDHIFKDIERAARVCYKSEGLTRNNYCLNGEPVQPDFVILMKKGYATVEELYNTGKTTVTSVQGNTLTITNESSAEKIVNSLIWSGHTSCLEHGTIYLLYVVPRKAWKKENDLNIKYSKNPYSKVESRYDEELDMYYYYITTNYRVIVENDWLNDLKFMCEPTEYHEKRIAVKFITDIGVTREANRHRVNSMAEQSTRFCNYSKDKFGNEISIALPTDLTEEDVHNSEVGFSDPATNLDCFHSMCQAVGEYDEDIFGIVDTWLFANLACEWSYMRLIKLGWKPQQARRVLPLDTNSELVHTAFVSDWKHFFELRADGTTGKPHPDMEALAKPLKQEFIERGYI